MYDRQYNSAAMRVLIRFIFAGVLLGFSLRASAQTPTINSRLPLQQDGPLTVSPWFTAAQTADSQQKNHYIYSAPPFFYGYYGMWGYSNIGYGYGWYAPFYGYGFYGRW